MNHTEQVRAVCSSSAEKFESDAAKEREGLKRSKFEGAAKAFRIVAAYYGSLPLDDLRGAMLADSDIHCKAAQDIREVSPVLAASFEGYACAYKSVADLCGRMLDQQAADLWQQDSQREEGSYQRKVIDYRADVERGMRP